MAHCSAVALLFDEQYTDIVPLRQTQPALYMSTPPSSSDNGMLAGAFLRQLTDNIEGQSCVNETSFNAAQMGVVSGIPAVCSVR